MKKLMIGLLMTTLLLAGCEKTTQEEAENMDTVSGYHIEDVLSVGEELKAEKVTISDEYNILYENGNGELVWLSLDENKVDFKVKKSDQPYSYVVREKNRVKEDLFIGYTTRSSVYTLYLKSEELQGGAYNESCGENCTKEIQVDVLD